MCFYSADILCCVRDFHISHTLVNHNWTVVTQRMNSKHVCFQFGPRGPAKAEAGSETTPQIYWPHHLLRLRECHKDTHLTLIQLGLGQRGWGVCTVMAGGGYPLVQYSKPVLKHTDIMLCNVLMHCVCSRVTFYFFRYPKLHNINNPKTVKQSFDILSVNIVHVKYWNAQSCCMKVCINGDRHTRGHTTYVHCRRA